MSTIALAMGANSAVAELDKKEKRLLTPLVTFLVFDDRERFFVNPVGKKAGKLEQMAQIPLLNLNSNL